MLHKAILANGGLGSVSPCEGIVSTRYFFSTEKLIRKSLSKLVRMEAGSRASRPANRCLRNTGEKGVILSFDRDAIVHKMEAEGQKAEAAAWKLWSGYALLVVPRLMPC